MTIYVKTTIAGAEVTDIYSVSIRKSSGNDNASSSFELKINNLVGINKSTYPMNSEVIVYANKDINPPTTVVFSGVLENVSFESRESNDTMILSGRDYTARLMDRTVEPEVYNNQEVSAIVLDIISKYTSDITTTHVQTTSYIVSRKAFNHTSVFDAIKSLAELSGYSFYVDENKDLHFEQKSATSSGLLFNNGNVLNASFEEARDTVFNQIWIYGDRYLDGYKETFIAGSPVGGSVFILSYKPHNVVASVAGSIVQPGAIENMVVFAGSNTKYLVNFEDKRITFTSGTTYGDNVPASGASVVLEYQRDLPIVKVGDSIESQNVYGKRVKVIVDKDIKDPQAAEQLLSQELVDNAFPTKEGNLSIAGVVNVVPTQTCIVNLPYNGVDNTTYDIVSADYNFTKKNMLSEQVLKVKVNKRMANVIDTLKDIITGLKKVQGADISDSDIITRFQYATGSMGIGQQVSRVYNTTISGGFVLSHPSLGNLGSCTGADMLGASDETTSTYFVTTYGTYIEQFYDTDFFQSGSATWDTGLNQLKWY